MIYRDAEGSELDDGGVEDVPAAAHDSNGGSMFAELGGYLKTDTGAAASQQSYLPLHHIALEGRLLHFSLQFHRVASNSMIPRKSFLLSILCLPPRWLATSIFKCFYFQPTHLKEINLVATLQFLFYQFFNTLFV